MKRRRFNKKNQEKHIKGETEKEREWRHFERKLPPSDRFNSTNRRDNLKTGLLKPVRRFRIMSLQSENKTQ